MKRSALINLISSMLATILVVIAVLFVMVFTGKLDIQQPKLVISSASHSITYDGKKLVDGKWTLMEGSLKEGHKLSVSVTGSQTNVGMSENYLTAVVLNANGDDVTEEYTIEYRPGALQVKARELTIVAGSDMKLYDGKPLTCDAYMLQSSVALLPTDQLSVTVKGSITEIGKTDNIITSAKVISKATGEDVSRNYSIHSKNGKLIVYDENTLVIRSADASKEYDGTPLTKHEYMITNGKLREGHSLEVTFKNSQTLPGWCENKFEYRILDANGNDVTDTYDHIPENGLLTVKQNTSLQITNINAKAEYASYNIASIEYMYDDLPLPEGHTLDVDVAFSEYTPSYNIGETVDTRINSSTVKVLDAKGNDVTYCFEYFDESNDVPGTLEVIADYECFRVTPSVTGDIYLKYRSYGDYNLETKSWVAAPDYDNKISGISSPYYLTSSALSQKLAMATIKPTHGIFAMPYYALDEPGNQQQTSDVQMVGDASNTYTVQYMQCKTSELLKGTITLPAGATSDDEKSYAEFVKDNYLFVDDDTLTYLTEYAKSNGFDSNKSTRELVAMIADHLRNSNKSGLTYNTQYNPAVDTDNNPTIAFLSGFYGGEGVCRHYAQAATLLYRSLGIPARYTVGYYGNAKAENQEIVITNKQAHAWVEVYLDGLGWVYVEVTGSTSDIKLTPKNVERRYDDSGLVMISAQELTTGSINSLKKLGTPLAPTFDGNILTCKIKDNDGNIVYTVGCSFDGAQTDPGKRSSSISTCTILDKDEKIVYLYDAKDKYAKLDVGNFKISFGQGTLHVYRAEIKLTMGNQTKMYGDNLTELNPEDLTKENLDANLNWSVEWGELDDGCTVSAKVTLKSYTPNTYQNIYSFECYKNENGTKKDCTNEYKYTCSGELEITERHLKIYIGDVTVDYDGSPKTYDDLIKEGVVKEGVDYRVEGSLASNDEIFWDFSDEEVTNKGQSVEISLGKDFEIRNSKNEDISYCYSIEVVNGTLKIDP